MGCEISSGTIDKPNPIAQLPILELCCKCDDLKALSDLLIKAYIQHLVDLSELLQNHEIKTTLEESLSSLKACAAKGQYCYVKEALHMLAYSSDKLNQALADRLFSPISKECSNCMNLNDKVCDLRQSLKKETMKSNNFQKLYDNACEEQCQEIEECKTNYQLLSEEFDRSLNSRNKLSAEYDQLLTAYDTETTLLKSQVSKLQIQMNGQFKNEEALKLRIEAIAGNSMAITQVCAEYTETVAKLRDIELELLEVKHYKESDRTRRKASCILRIRRSVAATQALALTRWAATVPTVHWTQEVASQLKPEFLSCASKSAIYSASAASFFERWLDSRYSKACFTKKANDLVEFEANALLFLQTSNKATQMLSNLIAAKGRNDAHASLLLRLIGASKAHSMPLDLATLINRFRVDFNSLSSNKLTLPLHKALRMVFDEFKEHVEVRDFVMTRLCPKDVSRQEFLPGLIKFALGCLGCIQTFTSCIEEASPHPKFTEEELLETIGHLQIATSYQMSEYLLRIYLLEVCKHPQICLRELQGSVNKVQLLGAVEDAYYVSAGLVSSFHEFEERLLD